MSTVYPVWNFDATGRVIKNIGRDFTYLYSIVMRDTINKKIIPFAEFATNSHTVCNISKYLSVIKNNNKYIAPFIVVDESWALISSVMETFNGCSALSYINWTWDVIHTDFNSNRNLHCFMKTRLFLCHTHLFKNIIRKTNKIISEKKSKNSMAIKSLFQFCFTLLQNSISMDEFENLLLKCFLLFCSHLNTEPLVREVNNLIVYRNLSILSEIHDPVILNNKNEVIFD